MRYYIADTHFFHRSLNEKMDQRGFEDIDQMNEYMIDQWNSKVRCLRNLFDPSFHSTNDEKNVYLQYNNASFNSSFQIENSGRPAILSYTQILLVYKHFASFSNLHNPIELRPYLISHFQSAYLYLLF